MAGFFTGFATGFANRASEINRENREDRSRAIERAMDRFAATIERRREELIQRDQRVAQARAIASMRPDISESDALGFIEAGYGDQLRNGQIVRQNASVPQGGLAAPQGSSSAPTTTTAVPTTEAATAPPSGGLMQPPVAPATTQAAPSGIQQQQAPVDPRAAVTPTAAMDTPEPSLAQRIGRTMFGRGPMDGVAEEVRDRYMRESGMTREQMDRLLAAPQQAPQIEGQYRFNQFTPDQIARMASSFTNRDALRKFIESHGQDTSGFATLEELTRAQAIVRAAGAGSRGDRRDPGTQFTAPQAINQTRELAGRVLGVGVNYDAQGNVILQSENAQMLAQANRVAALAGQLLIGRYGGVATEMPRAIQDAAQQLNVALPREWSGLFTPPNSAPTAGTGSPTQQTPQTGSAFDRVSSEARAQIQNMERILETHLTPPAGQQYTPNQIAARQAAAIREITRLFGTLSPELQRELDAARWSPAHIQRQ